MVEAEGERAADALSETVYQASRWLARAGWLILLLSLFREETRSWAWPAAQFVVPGLLCAGYAVLAVAGRRGLERYGLRTFFSLEGIGYLYTNRRALAASWQHFLALDLFAGAFMVQDGLARSMSCWLILLCLPFTLIVGPIGLLLYILLRFAT